MGQSSCTFVQFHLQKKKQKRLKRKKKIRKKKSGLDEPETITFFCPSRVGTNGQYSSAEEKEQKKNAKTKRKVKKVHDEQRAKYKVAGGGEGKNECGDRFQPQTVDPRSGTKKRSKKKVHRPSIPERPKDKGSASIGKQKKKTKDNHVGWSGRRFLRGTEREREGGG